MVRFKNRYLIVELLNPASATLQVDPSSSAGPSYQPIEVDDDDEDGGDEEDDADELARIPDTPFLLPAIPDLNKLKDGDEGGKGIYRATRDMVQDVFGDEGWGRVSSSFRSKPSRYMPVPRNRLTPSLVVYHSPLTTITLVRIARPHVRTVHAAMTLLSSIDGRPVLPRVIGVSGTIKKAQARIMVYHRMVIAQLLARYDEGALVISRDVTTYADCSDPSNAQAKQQVEKRVEAEQKGIQALED